jgi:pentatricopeptide repeat protein
MAVSGLANSLLALRRYKEAVALYERLMKEGVRSSETSLNAAQAYIGLGDESNVRRVLGAVGFSDERIQATRDIRA